MSKFKQLINCHSHSHFSLDGAATVEDIVVRNKELGATHVALTEHGNMNGLVELYEKSKKHGMKPIFGIELYVQPPFLEEMRPVFFKELTLKSKKAEEPDEEKLLKAMKNEYVHLTVHFKDEWAYNYFTKLSPVMEERALIKWGERKPIATLEEIAGAAGHITICSSCLIGIVHRFLLPRRTSKFSSPELAEKAYKMIRDLAGEDNFYVEVFPHIIDKEWSKPIKNKETGALTPGKFVANECTDFARNGDIQKPCNEFIINLANKYNDPIIVSLDSHFANPEQQVVQEGRLGNGQEQWKFSNSYHICPSHEAFEVLKQQLNINEKEFEKWIDNSYKFASQFDNFTLTTNKERWVLQPLPENYQERLIEIINASGRMNWNDQTMCDRLRYEIEVLADNGKINLLSYFFTVEDIANYCRNNDVLINVRGSASGSLLLYILGVSAVNPLKHDLSFERFLTLGRVKANTMPDVDMDVSDQTKVFEHLENKYQDAFCRISVDSQLKLKSSIKDTERALIGKVRPETEKLCVGLIKHPSIAGISDYDWVFGYKDDAGMTQRGLIETHVALKKYAKDNPEVWKTVTEMIGIIRQKSVHACGAVIADQPVQNYVPVTKIGDARATGYSPKQLESAGLIKFDILGLNTLRDIQAALKLIKEQHSHEIDPFNLPHSKEVFDAFGTGDTVTVFQFDTDTVRPYLKAIKPKSLDELAAVTALCRPGTLDAPSGEFLHDREMTLSEVYVARAQGRPIHYINNDLEPIMKETLGIQLYQEQTLRIFRDLADYTYEQAETVRRGIGKKEAQVLASCMDDLKKSCLAKGWTEDQIKLLQEQIMASSRYSFNKSHAISYAYVAYACLYLRLHYPLEWWTAILANSNKDDLKYYWPYAAQWIKMPEINGSDKMFYINSNDGKRFIQAPITLLDGVGPATTAEISLKKPFKDFDDFFNRIDRRIINKRTVQKFILSGLLDELFEPGITDLEKITRYWNLRKNKDDAKDDGHTELFNFSPLQKLRHKRDIYTVYRVEWSNEAIPYLLKAKFLTQVGPTYAYVNEKNKELNGKPLLKVDALKRRLDTNNLKEEIFAMVGYINEASEVTYSRKSGSGETTPNTMMKFLIEAGDLTIEAIKWPDWGSTTHGLEKDYSEKIGLFLLQRKVHPERGLQFTVKHVIDISVIDQ